MRIDAVVRFFVSALLVAGISASLALSAVAQERRPPASAGREQGPPLPPKTPVTLDQLFDRLSLAKDAPEAEAISRQIESRWMRSGSDTTDLLMQRVAQLMRAEQNEAALELLDYIVMLRPEWAEAYNKRATVLYLMEDVDGAMRDIQATLTREPRHYMALAGMGMIFYTGDNKKAAYAVFRRALELHPHIDKLKEISKRLELDVGDKKL